MLIKFVNGDLSCPTTEKLTRPVRSTFNFCAGDVLTELVKTNIPKEKLAYDPFHLPPK